MNIKRAFVVTAIFLSMFSVFFLFSLEGSKDLVASLPPLPGFIDIVKAIDDVYTEGKIQIGTYPFPRSVDNVLTGKADFHLPISVTGKLPPAARAVTEKVGTASYVIYSHKDNPITKKMLDDAVARGGEFPYKIEGVDMNYGFPMIESFNAEQSLQKLTVKRIDAFLIPQEDADLVIRNLKLANIHREHFKDYDDVIIINAKNPEADKLDKIISDALKKLKAAGKLQQLYGKLHQPYDNWQPAKMGW